MPLSNPVIVLPGITANYLRDDYVIPPEIVWSVLTKAYERVALHPDDLRYEGAEPAQVRPGQAFEVVYRELVEELRFNLREREDEPVPVHFFAYDWRQPLAATEKQLADFIQEVIDRTRLLRHYDRAGYAANPKVNLVGHSMGGLIIAGYLESRGAEGKVGKVATVAAPFQGSFEAVIKVTTGTADLGTSPPSSREREAARLTPALYHLLPSFSAGLTVPSGLPPSLFDPRVWQTSVVATIEQYIRLHGLVQANRRQQATKLLEAMLAEGLAHRTRIDGLNLATAGLSAGDWLCVVGVDAETRVRLEVIREGGAPTFKFHSSDRQNLWNEADAAIRRLTGDNTVPFEGALPRFLPLESIVCVKPDDFGYWEFQDRALLGAAGFHGILPGMDMLHRLIVRHFTGRPDRRDNTWGRPAPGVAQWQPPLSLTEKQ